MQSTDGSCPVVSPIWFIYVLCVTKSKLNVTDILCFFCDETFVGEIVVVPCIIMII